MVLEVSIARTNDRIAMIESALETARDSSNDDTKSSAGDKYETSREMIQQDINRYQGQLLEANKDLLQLTNIATTIADATDFVKLGSLVKTNLGLYFIATSIGALKIDDMNVFAISPVSPIGQLLLSKKTGDSFLFNKLNQTITGVY
ncbi:3-oxoacyl-ACP synthase [Sphingobacterium ginsenosidimutans]